MTINKKLQGFKLWPLIVGVAFLASCGSSVSQKNPNINNPQNPNGLGPAPVSLSSDGGTLNQANLGSSGNYVILSKTGVSNVTGSSIVGHIGASPVAASYITGFSLTADMSNQFSTSPSVAGKIYAADYSAPTPANLTSAISSMETSYTDAAGRTSPNFNELASGNLGGLTLAPGLYKWSTSVLIPTTVTLSGSANDVWIFQISGDVSIDAAQQVILSGGAQAKNIFWQVAGQVTMGTTSHFEGIILCKTSVVLNTQASMNGRIFAQTMVSLDNNNVVQSAY